MEEPWPLLYLFSTILLCTSTSGVGPGPYVKQSYGEVWPKPQKIENFGNNFMVVRPPMFSFEILNNTCDIVDQALKRYYSLLLRDQGVILKSFKGSTNHSHQSWKLDSGYRGHLDVLQISLHNPCETWPHEDMDESYQLLIDTPSNPKAGHLLANTNWGLLRGLETFSQLVHNAPSHSSLRIKSSFIQDYPRFPFRSVLIDTARHFIPKSILLHNLDIMAMHKYNVFHWHIVDDNSFPFQSKKYPELSDKGAYHPFTHVYTEKDVAQILEYARVRGIRVIPEFDSPGHTGAWGPGGSPGLLTQCYTNSTPPLPDGTWGPIDPTLQENYKFLRNFFSEVVSVFPDKYLHLGGDEVDFSCWESNPHIQSFMEGKGWKSYAKLEGLYMQKLVQILESFVERKSLIVWQEVVDNGVRLHKDSVINVWRGSHQSELQNVTRMGYKAVLYACWYLDRISWGIDWPNYYKCDPQNFTGTLEEQDLVMGGGAALWGEFMDGTNLIPRLWPRASAPAERLWSSKEVDDVKEAAPRLEEHRCRLLRRGYRAEPPNGPGYCLYDSELEMF